MIGLNNFVKEHLENYSKLTWYIKSNLIMFRNNHHNRKLNAI